MKAPNKNVDVSSDSRYINLANSIVLQAVADYREAIKMREANYNYKLGEGTNRRFKKAEAIIKECEQFFQSQWFAKLTLINGKELQETLRRETHSVIADRLY